MHIPQIQGLRALAAILIIIFHAKFISGGFIGVDIFYVISGYLITGLLLREIYSTGKLDLQSFYQRRIKRLLPTSFFVLSITSVAGFLVLPTVTRNEFGRDLFAAASYISNYFFAWWQNDYQNLNATPSPFIHFWSLAVEEQFYLVWPIFIIFLSKYGKKIVFLGIAIATSLSLLLSIHQTQSSPIWAFYSLSTRAWELGIGALLLFLPAHLLKHRLLPWLGFIGILVATLKFDENTVFPGLHALLPVVATALLLATISIWPPLFSDLTNNRFSQWAGKISYPLYLWHWPLLVLPSSALGRGLSATERIFCILVTFALAHFTSKLIEQPFRYRYIEGKKIYRLFAVSTFTCLLAGVLISSTSTTVLQIKDSDLKFNLAKVLEKPSVNRDGCNSGYGTDKSGLCEYGDLNSKNIVVLYGDSHAAQWFPALEKIATKQGFKLVSLTKAACPAVEVKRDDKGAYKNQLCKNWRLDSIARIKKLRPDAVLTSSLEHYTPPSYVSSRANWWRDGQAELLSSLRGLTKHLIYIGDTPRPEVNIPSCLASRTLTSCNTSKKSQNQIIAGFEKIDPTPWLCTRICPAILDGYVVYRDESHISIAAVLSLMPELEKALRSKGLFS